MSSAGGVMPNLAFGWRINENADGFEQSHGRFIIEVFWNSKILKWGIAVWANRMIGGDNTQLIVREGTESDLTDAKKAGLRMAAVLEKEAIMEDIKSR